MKKILPIIFFMSLFLVGMVAQMMLSGIETKADRIAEKKKIESLYEKKFKQSIFETTKGTKYNSKSFKDEIVVLNFWASWCFPCIEEFKSLKIFVSKYQGKVKVLGINNDTETPLKKIAQAEKKYELNFESVFDKNSSITTNFNLSIIPATFIFHKGKYVYHTNKQVKFTSKDFTKIVDELIQK